jgi:methyl-accepting chemotaxis protein
MRELSNFWLTQCKKRRSLERLAQTISDVGANAAQSSQLANPAVGDAELTSTTIDEWASIAQEIGKVTDLISAIAAQTNLLAPSFVLGE